MALFDRVQSVGSFLRTHKKDILVNASIGMAAKVLAVSTLTASGGLAVAVGGAALASIGREVYAHYKERRHNPDHLVGGQYIDSSRIVKKVLLASAISGVTFGALHGADYLLNNTEAGQKLAGWAGQKLESVFNAVSLPSFMKGWGAKPVEPSYPSVDGKVIPRGGVVPPVVQESLLPNEQVVSPTSPAPVKHLFSSLHSHSSSADIVPKSMQADMAHEVALPAVDPVVVEDVAALPEIAPVDEPTLADLPPLTEESLAEQGAVVLDTVPVSKPDLSYAPKGFIEQVAAMAPKPPVDVPADVPAVAAPADIPAPVAVDADVQVNALGGQDVNQEIHRPSTTPDTMADTREAALHRAAEIVESDPDVSPEQKEMVKSLTKDNVAAHCKADISQTVSAENTITTNCVEYKDSVGAGDTVIVENTNQPDAKKGLRLLFQSAKEKTSSFISRAVGGPGGVVPEMTEAAQRDAMVPQI